MLGLDLSLDDAVLAVAGSGDQAFAFLEFARHVKAVDLASEQIEFMRKRAEALRNGNYQEFLGANVTGCWDGYFGEVCSSEFVEFNKIRRREYFAKDGVSRLERIRKNLSNLIIAEPANILEIAQTEPGFSKIYLSNVLGHDNDCSDTKITRILGNIAKNMPSDGLIYVANHDSLNNRTQRTQPFYTDEKRNDKGLGNDSSLPPELKVDRNLSMEVRRYEQHSWKPAVYRRS